MRSLGVFVNAPDVYFAAGANKMMFYGDPTNFGKPRRMVRTHARTRTPAPLACRAQPSALLAVRGPVTPLPSGTARSLEPIPETGFRRTQDSEQKQEAVVGFPWELIQNPCSTPMMFVLARACPRGGRTCCSRARWFSMCDSRTKLPEQRFSDARCLRALLPPRLLANSASFVADRRGSHCA